jgi:hypothetical protein
MWTEWLVRTLRPRRDDAEPAPRPRHPPPHAAPPERADRDAELAAVEERE